MTSANIASIRHLRIAQRALCAIIAACVCLWAVIDQARCANASPPRLDGTFLQLKSAHLTWSTKDWEHVFDYFTAMQLHVVVVQWTQHDKVAFNVPANVPGGDDSQPSTLENLLRLADQRQMQVSVGLFCEERYWQEIQGSIDQRRAYLRSAREQSAALAAQIAPIARAHPSFRGWYMCEEVDDTNWLAPDKVAVLTDHFRQLRQTLKSLDPSAEIAVSGFSGGSTDPRHLEEFWTELMKNVPFDTVYYQDGIGTGRFTTNTIAPYFAAMQHATAAAGSKLGIVVETFIQTDGPPLNSGSFLAVPAPMERIQQQLAAAAPFGAELIAFAVPDYVTPLGNIASARLYRSYLDFLNSPH